MISSVLPYAEIIDTMSDLEFEEFTLDPETMALTAAKVTLPSFSETYQSGFWYQLEQLRNFLKPLKETTVTLSARKTPTAHLDVGETHILDTDIRSLPFSYPKMYAFLPQKLKRTTRGNVL